MRVKTKRSEDLTLRDILSRLTFDEAVKLLGGDARRCIQHGGGVEILIDEQVHLGDDLFRLTLPDAVVTVKLESSARRRLQFQCSRCTRVCEHLGAAVSLILEEKVALGLAAPPSERASDEGLSEEALVQQAIEERAERARAEKMHLKSLDPGTPWTDYTLTSATSGKTYRVALRGTERGASYCSCPDFRKNTLGTCKHLLNAIDKVRRRFPASELARTHRQKDIAVHLRYGPELELRVLAPPLRDPGVRRLLEPLLGRPIDDVRDLLGRIRRVEAAGRDVLIYPDAEEHIQERLFGERIASIVREIRADPKRHPLRKDLLKAELLPYQLDGIAFAAGARRAVLADDMGLGKTIQAIGLAELLAREAGISRVLVVCPASVKAQWRAEILRFSARDCRLVVGSAAERPRLYTDAPFFTVVNYEQVLRDLLAIESAKWDLIVLDEGQRIKNWEAKTSRVIKGLKSPFALALSGTPLENRLEELFSVVEFIDHRPLGPAFRFFNRHRRTDEKGKILGYKNLADLRERLRPVLLRRTRAQVMRELPPRTTEVIRITPTEEQLDVHRAWMRVVSLILRKAYLTEMDLLRLRKALLMCRMVADSTFLVDKDPPGYSTKLEKLDDLLRDLAAEEDRKIILFSEWTTMLGLVEKILKKRGLAHVRLDGSVPQKKRPSLVRQFQESPECRVFITTNAGATGLNLQAANTVINVDLPWNPAVLEQRIGRAHRMGQKRSVQVFVLVSEGTIEENLLATLSAKHELALAALDVESRRDEVELGGGMEDLRRRLEELFGARPEAEIDESARRESEGEVERLSAPGRVAAAGGQLLSSAFSFLRAVLPEAPESDESRQVADSLRRRLEECASLDGDGRPTLTITLPDAGALADMARTLAGLLVAGPSRGPGNGAAGSGKGPDRN
jgi:superfamily II DNA or RNA helicase